MKFKRRTLLCWPLEEFVLYIIVFKVRTQPRDPDFLGRMYPHRRTGAVREVDKRTWSHSLNLDESDVEQKTRGWWPLQVRNFTFLQFSIFQFETERHGDKVKMNYHERAQFYPKVHNVSSEVCPRSLLMAWF